MVADDAGVEEFDADVAHVEIGAEAVEVWLEADTVVLWGRVVLRDVDALGEEGVDELTSGCASRGVVTERHHGSHGSGCD